MLFGNQESAGLRRAAAADPRSVQKDVEARGTPPRNNRAEIFPAKETIDSDERKWNKSKAAQTQE